MDSVRLVSASQLNTDHDAPKPGWHDLVSSTTLADSSTRNLSTADTPPKVPVTSNKHKAIKKIYGLQRLWTSVWSFSRRLRYFNLYSHFCHGGRSDFVVLAEIMLGNYALSTSIRREKFA
jgi:hypothetical protein